MDFFSCLKRGKIDVFYGIFLLLEKTRNDSNVAIVYNTLPTFLAEEKSLRHLERLLPSRLNEVYSTKGII